MKRLIGLISLAIIIMLAGCSSKKTNETDESDIDLAKASQEITQSQPATIVAGQQVNEYYFTRSGQHPEKALVNVINSATQTLDIAIYSLTHPDIVAAIKEAKKRGVSVRLITDKSQVDGKSQGEAAKILGSAGIPMKINKHSGLMHLKITIVDKKVATSGSFNYSKAASTTNDEVLMVMRGEEVAKSFTEQFEKMWNDTKGFETIEKKIAQ
ncbi:phospholipase D family protein [Paenibacillus periandrae]|uniref:phospholipase D family nuclease n=1 Tax=Paenibacillus periandrae TaxID=1761741 RepID=UPI001F08E530|nr:phospholipase D family protein [Paenibacillus periandrae]